MDTEEAVDGKKGRRSIVALLALLGAAIAGVAGVFTSLDEASRTVRCLPSSFGFSQDYVGKGTLSYVIQTHDWVSIGTLRKTKGTGDHGCYDNCRGEPTRTNYQIHMTADDFQTPKLGDRKLASPNLTCKSGPCPWSQPLHVRLEADNRSASASFDVWSNPTSWELSADVLEYQVVSEELVEESLTVGPDPLVQIRIPQNAVSASFTGSMEDGQPFSFEPGKNGQGSLLQHKVSVKRNGHAEHLYLLQDNRCS
jgi:hypothetical protein